jgi:hypothetical protein
MIARSRRSIGDTTGMVNMVLPTAINSNVVNVAAHPASLAAPEHQRRIDATEGKIVAHRILDIELAARAGQVVKLAAERVDLSEIDRRRMPAVPHHLDREPRLQGSACA